MSTFVTTEKLSRLMDAVKAKIATKLDATGIKNDALTTDAGYVLDARMGKTLGDRTTSLETKVSDLYFATDSNGKWGYKATKNGAVTPFRNPTGDATAAEVLSGKTFSSATLENATGTMANNGAWTGATTGEGSITIPAGYHNGSGSVSGKTSYNDGYAKGYAGGKASVLVKTYTKFATNSTTQPVTLVFDLSLDGYTLVTAGFTCYDTTSKSVLWPGTMSLSGTTLSILVGGLGSSGPNGNIDVVAVYVPA